MGCCRIIPCTFPAYIKSRARPAYILFRPVIPCRIGKLLQNPLIEIRKIRYVFSLPVRFLHIEVRKHKLFLLSRRLGYHSAVRPGDSGSPAAKLVRKIGSCGKKKIVQAASLQIQIPPVPGRNAPRRRTKYHPCPFKRSNPGRLRKFQIITDQNGRLPNSVSKTGNSSPCLNLFFSLFQRYTFLAFPAIFPCLSAKTAVL